MELWGKDSTFRGSVCPVFYSRSGEAVTLPVEFQAAAARLTSAVACVGCRHCHLLEPKTIVVDAGANTTASVERAATEPADIGAA